MKEIMVPYILICWLLLKFKVIAGTARNYSIMTGLGLLIAFSLFTAHRYFSPADLTMSTMVMAPRAVLSPAIGQEIDKIAVTHNQRVKKGELLYTLVDDDLRARELAANEELNAARVNLAQMTRDFDRKKRLDPGVIPVSDVEIAADMVDVARAEVAASEAKLKSIRFDLDRLDIYAPFNGQVSHVYVGEGSRIGALHLWDTSQKFVVMRIPDQAYGFIKPGNFAEFYVDAYPGHIFRARVHSITGATGESAGSLFPQEAMVGRQVQLGAMPVGRTIILEFVDPPGYWVPIGATGSAWVSVEKPALLSFLDVIGAATLRLFAAKAFLGAL
jgi:multidrug resistance efflux pump